MFGDEALQPELASLAEQVQAYLAVLKKIEKYPLRPPAQKPGKVGLAH
jgi:hypothetical protein